MKDLVIVGDGGFGKEAEWLVKHINDRKPTWNFLGFISKEKQNPNIIGDDDYVIHFENEFFVAIAIGTSGIREKLYYAYKVNSNI